MPFARSGLAPISRTGPAGSVGCMVLGVAYVVVAALALGLGSLAQGVAAARHDGPFLDLLTRPLFVVGLLGDVVGFAAHVLALQSVSVAVAQGAVSGSLAVTALGARWWLGARLDRAAIAAIGVVCGGLVVLAAFTDGTGTTTDTVALVVALAALTLVLALVGGAAALAGRATGGLALSVVSGLAFAVCSIAVRLVDTSSVLAVLTDPALLVIGAAGTVGGLAWAAALRAAPVTTVTAVVVIAEVLPPSLLGPWLLGDTTATGFAVVAPLVLLATAAAAVILARAGHDTRVSVPREGHPQPARAAEGALRSEPALAVGGRR